MYDNANEPASPILDDAVESYSRKIYFGLTKREMFAMAAMQGFLASFGRHDVTDVGEIASDSVMNADALLAELERTK